MEVARTILAQIGTNTIMCLGVPRHTIRAIPETLDAVDAPLRHLGGLEFKFTNCPKVRSGTVRVTLAGDDTYNVQILNMRGREIYSATGIYNDMLGGPHGVIEGVTG